MPTKPHFAPVRRSNGDQQGWSVCDMRIAMCYGQLFVGPTAFRDCSTMCKALNAHLRKEKTKTS